LAAAGGHRKEEEKLDSVKENEISAENRVIAERSCENLCAHIRAAASLGSKRARRPCEKALAELASIQHEEIKRGHQHGHNEQSHVIPGERGRCKVRNMCFAEQLMRQLAEAYETIGVAMGAQRTTAHRKASSLMAANSSAH
jgi:hypothetical protein